MSFIGQLGFWPDPLVAAAVEIVGPNDLLGVWPLWGPQLVTHAGYLDSPNVFNANPPWTPLGVTFPDANTMKEDVSVGLHRINQSMIGKSSGGPILVSMDVEPAGRDWAAMFWWGPTYGSRGAYFQLTGAGAIGNISGAVTPTIQELTGEGHPGRYRCAMVSDVFAADEYVYLNASIANGVSSYAGDITKGLKLYNAQLIQTSIVTAPNLYGVQALAKYGDRFDLTNPTKASQPVLMPDDWDGIECARFSGVNYLYADALAVQLSGIAAPTALVVACSTDAIDAVARNVVGLGHSINSVPYAVWRRTGASIEYIQRNDAGTTVTATYGSTLTAAQRTILAARKAAALHGYKNAVADAANPMAASAGQSTFDRFTVGAVRNVSVPAGTGFWQGTARCLIAAKSDPSDAAMQAASRLVQAYCPV